MDDSDLRFGGIARLYPGGGLERLRRAHVAVVGIGGVGSWTAEALARSGVGRITLVDLDEVCVSNVNRQLHAVDGAIGQPKVEAMAARIRAINPQCAVGAIAEYFTASTAEGILAGPFDYIVDAIDRVTNKCLLIASCRQRGLRILTVGGAGGRRDPTAARVADLAATTHDALLQEVRKTLRAEHGFPREAKKPFGVPCVFSTEPAVCPAGAGNGGHRIDCESGYGTASFVTGAFGLIAAGWVVNEIAADAKRP